MTTPKAGRSLRPRVAAAAASLVVIAALGACGSDDTGSSASTDAVGDTTAAVDSTAPADTAAPSDSAAPVESTDSTASTTPSAPSGETIVIASITSDTGGIGNVQAGDGLEAWASYVNENGGLLGRPVEINRCDDQTDVQKYSECARKIVDDTSVLAVAGSQSRSAGDTGAPIFQETGMGYVCGNPANNVELGGANTFCITGGFATGFNAEFAYLASQGITKVTFITADSAGGHGAVDLLTKIAEPHGIELEGVFTSTTSPDYLPAATAAVASDSGAIVAALAPAQTLQVLQALQQSGNTKPILAGESTISAEVVADPAAEGLYVGQAYPSVDTESDEMSDFKASMEAIGSGANIGTGSLGGWLTGRVLESVINELSPDVSRETILTYLMNETVTDVALLPAELALANAPQSVPGMTSVANPTSSVYQIVDGKFVAVPDSAATLP